MSDIAIRFDGLLVAAAMLLGFALFALTMVAAGFWAWRRGPADLRFHWVARTAALYTGVSLLAFATLLGFLDAHGAWTGPAWFDLLALPWLGLVLAGFLRLVIGFNRR